LVQSANRCQTVTFGYPIIKEMERLLSECFPEMLY
jgi:hypothetical protein